MALLGISSPTRALQKWLSTLVIASAVLLVVNVVFFFRASSNLDNLQALVQEQNHLSR